MAGLLCFCRLRRSDRQLAYRFAHRFGALSQCDALGWCQLDFQHALEATPAEGGQITLVTHYQHGLRMSLTNSSERLDLPITVEVRDDGPGVADDLREHLFEPFITTKPKGSGLGLPLVAKIVGDHRGIVSYLPGEPGAVFRVRLPAAQSERSRRGR